MHMACWPGERILTYLKDIGCSEDLEPLELGMVVDAKPLAALSASQRGEDRNTHCWIWSSTQHTSSALES
jgi:hypothetical protein